MNLLKKMKGILMNWNNAISGISAGLSGHPEDWKDEENKETDVTPKEPHLLSFFNKLAAKGDCENITHKDLSQEKSGVTQSNHASYSSGY